MNKQNIAGMTVRKSRHFLLSWDFIVPVLVLIAGTILFRSTNLDISLQSRFFSRLSGWALYLSPIAMFIYHYGNIPALLLSIGALGVFILSFSKARLLPYRKIGIYLVLVMVLGPGLLVNSILKDNWGRPRPREIAQFGGDYAYEAPLTIDASSPGKSFPCGHATVGFYFFALAFVLRQRKPRLAALVTFAALVWGTVIGWVRMGQGGHFASDVLWAGVLVYLCSYLLYRALGMHRNVFFVPSGLNAQRKLKPHQKVLLTILGLLIVIGVMLATPYSARQDYYISRELAGSKPQSLNLDLAQANLKITLGNNTKLHVEVNGFGFPGSKLKSNSGYMESGFDLTQAKRGFFTELTCDANLSVDTLKVAQLHTIVHKGELSLFLPSSFSDTIYVAPGTKVSNTNAAMPVIVRQARPVGKYWVDAPLLKLFLQR